MKKIFFIAIIIRLVCLYLFRDVTNYDLQSYLQVGELTLKGLNIYPEIAKMHHPYLPFFLYIEAIAVKIGQISLMGPMSPILIIKLILVCFDLGITYLIYLLSKKNLKTTFIYAINPVTILIITLHGQFDVIPIFFVLLTIYLLHKRNQLAGVLSFSFAILTKTWPILLAVPILRKIYDRHPRSNRGSIAYFIDSRFRGNDKVIKILFLTLCFPIIFSGIYCRVFGVNPIAIAKTLISYQGLWGIWGLWSLLGSWRLRWQLISTFLFLSGYLVYSYFNTEKNLIKNILKLLFFFFIFTPNFSIQYFAWIIPFLVLVKPRYYRVLIILITIYLFTFYYYWLFCQSCISTPDWLTVVQNITGFILWLSFIKVGYLSSK